MTEIKYPGGVMNYFHYDALLRRYAMEDSNGLSYFTWDANGMNLLCERDASGTVIAEYTHGYTPVDGIGSGVGQKLVQGGATYHEYDVGRDTRGSVYRRVDANGNVTGYFEYNAFGVPLREEEIGAHTRFRYQPNWIDLPDDPNKVLKLTPTRIYHAGVGRFLGRDAVSGLAGGYSYTNARHLTTVDPSGGPKEEIDDIPVPPITDDELPIPDVPLTPTPLPGYQSPVEKGEEVYRKIFRRDGKVILPSLLKSQSAKAYGHLIDYLYARRSRIRSRFMPHLSAVVTTLAYLGHAGRSDHRMVLRRKNRKVLAIAREAARLSPVPSPKKQEKECCCPSGDWTVKFFPAAGIGGGVGRGGGGSAARWWATCDDAGNITEMSGLVFSLYGPLGIGLSGGVGGGAGAISDLVKPRVGLFGSIGAGALGGAGVFSFEVNLSIEVESITSWGEVAGFAARQLIPAYNLYSFFVHKGKRPEGVTITGGLGTGVGVAGPIAAIGTIIWSVTC